MPGNKAANIVKEVETGMVDVKLADNNTKTTLETPGVELLIIGIISPEDDRMEGSLWNGMYADFRKDLEQKYVTKTVTDASSAIAALSDKGNLPRVAFVVSAEVFKPGHTEDYFRMHQQLASFAKDCGGVVIIGAMVPSFARMDELTFIFKKAYDLPWKPGSYTKNDQMPNPSMKTVFGEESLKLLKEGYPKSLFLSGVEKDGMVYVAKSKKDKIKPNQECQIVFQKYGKGRIGWIGDVNNSQGNAVTALHAMISFGRDSIDSDGTACHVCQRTPTTDGCNKCKKTKYCSTECRKYDWIGHKANCVQPKWKNPAENKFERIFPGLGTDDGFRPEGSEDTGNDNFEQAIFRLIDAFRVWHASNSATPLREPYSFDNDINQEVIEEFETFLKKAKAAAAIPCWWDEVCEERAMEYATWDTMNGLCLIPGSMKSEVYIGKRVRNDHVAKQYGGDDGVWTKIKELAGIIGGMEEPKGDDAKYW